MPSATVSLSGRRQKELKSFLHSLTICDKVASGNNATEQTKAADERGGLEDLFQHCKILLGGFWELVVIVCCNWDKSVDLSPILWTKIELCTWTSDCALKWQHHNLCALAVVLWYHTRLISERLPVRFPYNDKTVHTLFTRGLKNIQKNPVPHWCYSLNVMALFINQLLFNFCYQGPGVELSGKPRPKPISFFKGQFRFLGLYGFSL
jgi:hypothetical protein